MGDAADPNATDPAGMWNGPMGQRWLANHERLDHLLEPFGVAAMDALGDLSGRNVLDVGCGTGEMVADLASRVGPEGRVVGVDVSAALVERARARFGSDQADFRVADASSEELGHGYDAVLSRFGTTFFSDPAAAFDHIRSSMVPAGRMSMVVWQSASENEWVQVPLAAAAAVIELPKQPAPRSPGPFAFAEADYIASILESAGFGDVEVTDFRARVHVGVDAVDAAHFLMSVLPTGSLLDAFDRDTTASVIDAVEMALEQRGDVDLEGAAWIVTAQNR